MSLKPPAYIIGLDLGKKNDFTAIVVLRRKPIEAYLPAEYDLIHLDRWRHREYLATIPVVRQVQDQITAEFVRWMTKHRGGVSGEIPVITTVVDQTGVGEAVIESLRAAGLSCHGITIHGGEKVSEMEGGWRVPKRELVGTVEVLLQNRRLRVAKELPLADVLLSELQSFKATIKLSTGHVSYAADESWRDGEHDDTVLALALAAWMGESFDPNAWDEFDRWVQAEGLDQFR